MYKGHDINSLVHTFTTLLWNNSLQLLVTSYLHMLSNWVYHFESGMEHCPIGYLLISEYRWNLPLPSGKHSSGNLSNLFLISSNVDCCSCSQINCLSFLIKSYMGFKSFCRSGQNMLKKLPFLQNCYNL